MEFLEDTEKRILLSAISREKKVCEQVDKESYKETHETSLTDICKSLEYKFMYDRLFKKIYQQGRADAIDEINNREKNIPYSDFARGFKIGYEKGQMIIAEHDAKVRTDAFKPIAKIINDFWCGEIESPLVALDMIDKIICENTKEQSNE